MLIWHNAILLSCYHIILLSCRSEIMKKCTNKWACVCLTPSALQTKVAFLVHPPTQCYLNSWRLRVKIDELLTLHLRQKNIKRNIGRPIYLLNVTYLTVPSPKKARNVISASSMGSCLSSKSKSKRVRVLVISSAI